MRFFRRLNVPAVLLFIAMTSSGADCGTTQPASQPSLPTVQMKIGGKSFNIEIANTDPTRTHGLMERDSMPADHGMIFVFSDDDQRSFWMKNTRFPLDIAYVDVTGKVVSIKHMKSYDLTAIPSDYPARYAIELNDGIAASAGLKAGDHIDIPAAAKDAKD